MFLSVLALINSTTKVLKSVDSAWCSLSILAADLSFCDCVFTPDIIWYKPNKMQVERKEQMKVYIYYSVHS